MASKSAVANRLCGKTKGRVIGPNAPTLRAPPSSHPERHDLYTIANEDPKRASTQLVRCEPMAVTNRTTMTISHSALRKRSHGIVMPIDDLYQFAHDQSC